MSYHEFGSKTWLKLNTDDAKQYQLKLYQSTLIDICERENEWYSPVHFLDNDVPDINNNIWNIIFLYNANPTHTLKILDNFNDYNNIKLCFTWGLANLIVFVKKDSPSENDILNSLKRTFQNREEWIVVNSIIKSNEIYKNCKLKFQVDKLTKPLDNLELTCA